MKRLMILLLLSPAIFAQPHKGKDPNEEPFLPIHPVYPYSPKLIKRDAEPELISQLTPELYTPKVDAKDSYSSSYSNSYQRDSYYPDYSNSDYSKTEPSASSAYPTYYNSDPTYATINAYSNSPYAAYNSYPTPAYTVNPAASSYPTSSYPAYYYQPSYYYPHYFNHALFPPPPPPSSSPSSGVDYHETPQDAPAEAESDKQDSKDSKETKTSKESEANQDASTGQFVDGGNYISGSSRDLDVQSSTYKVAGPYNQLERDVPAKSSNLPIPLPKTTYRVISVAGQPVGPDYPLPPAYVKAQQVEQLMSQTLAKLLAQKTQQQAGQPYEVSRDSTSGVNDASYVNQDAYNPNQATYVAVPNTRSKPAVTYVINTDGTAKVNEEQPSLQSSLESSSPQRTSGKNAKYSNVHYGRKPVSSSTYVSRGDRNKHHHHHHHRDSVVSSHQPDQTGDYGGYDGSQSYGGTVGSKEQSYGTYQSQSSSYQSKDPAVVAQTPRSYSYQYSAYDSDQTQQSYSQQDKINADDGNFGTKQYNKG
ncbi:hypothetical protein DMN91_007607 [Ooceraea biroi]|uniref:Uncharacterized protein n=1 Tax=Ooceraea biroi TaxID=2015173 RepID=A0A3L8DKU0_OOCBI|nr:adhesive plaque matrix protein-like [Ooceraea biroi]RLU20991.1 hypothetical protein DMN91_007607 [Ooceraea biroi]